MTAKLLRFLFEAAGGRHRPALKIAHRAVICARQRLQHAAPRRRRRPPGASCGGLPGRRRPPRVPPWTPRRPSDPTLTGVPSTQTCINDKGPAPAGPADLEQDSNAPR